MTATLAAKLTVTQFERRYGQEKPYSEFWYGQAIQKSTPTWIHGLLQKIVMDLLSAGGYKAGSEVKLKIDPELQPIPDVIATRGQIELPYPTKPLEIVIEILSDDDPMSRNLNEVQNVPKLGFEQVYVVDPETRLVFRWADHKLEEVNTLASVAVERIWSALDVVLE